MRFSTTLTDLGLDADYIEDRPSMDRPDPMTPKQIKAQYWLDLHDRGVSIRQIAGMVGYHNSTVCRAIREARALAEQKDNRDPHSVPLLGKTGYAPMAKDANRAPCQHVGAIKRGSSWVCTECNDYGRQNHRNLKLSPSDPLLIERRKKYLAESKAKRKPRKERRKAAVA